jgi:hypothetical protein
MLRARSTAGRPAQGGGDLGFAASRHFGEHGLRRRVDGLEIRRALDGTPVDQVLDAHAGFWTSRRSDAAQLTLRPSE